MERGVPLDRGVVILARGGVYDVELGGGQQVKTTLRGRIKQEERTGDRVVAGDRVEVRTHGDGTGTIERVEPRQNELARSSPGHGGRRAKVIVANVDQVVVVFALARPAPRLPMLDRFLVTAEANDLPVIILVNKMDLATDEEPLGTFDPYREAGYSVLPLSVEEGRGVESVRERVCGRTSVLTGPSGVGKSTLLNALQPGLNLRVPEPGDEAPRGRHTTVSARLVPLECGGYLADTPGLRALGLWDIPAAELDRCFPEFRPYLGECRFGGSCSHSHEPGCAVRAAVEGGRISKVRYESYLRLLADSSGATPHYR